MTDRLPTDLAALLADPARVADVPANQVPPLLTTIASEQARLAAVQGALAARLAAPPMPHGPDTNGEFLSVAQAAALVKLSVKSVRNKMSDGRFEKGVHWFRPGGAGPRFKRSALLAWLEQRTTPMPIAAPAPAGRAYIGLSRVDRRRRRA